MNSGVARAFGLCMGLSGIAWMGWSMALANSSVLRSETALPQYENGNLSARDLSQLIGMARAKFGIPAIAVAVISSEAIELQEIQGVRVLDGNAAATLHDFFHIGSCSKSVLSVMAARLVEQRLIDWNTPFFSLFPDLRAEADQSYRDITLEDLLLSRAGIKPFTDGAAEPLPVYDPSTANPRLEFMRFLVGQPPSAQIKDGRFEHLYSNPSYTMAAAMLERVSGLTYEALVERTLTEDLGLPVHIGWPNELSADQPWGHMITRKGVEAFPPGHEYRLPHLITPAGDLSMSPESYARYTQLHLQGLRGSAHYISSESYRHMHFGHDGFSLGIANGSLAGKKRYSGFDGSAGTFFCRSVVVPQSDFAFTLMMNAGSGSGSIKAVDWLTMRIVKKHFNWWWKFWL